MALGGVFGLVGGGAGLGAAAKGALKGMAKTGIGQVLAKGVQTLAKWGKNIKDGFKRLFAWACKKTEGNSGGTLYPKNCPCPISGGGGTAGNAGGRTPQDILMPGGKPIGGGKPTDVIREMVGDAKVAGRLFRELTAGGKVTSHEAGRVTMKLAGGGTASLRLFASWRSPGVAATIDLSDIPGVWLTKIKFKP